MPANSLPANPSLEQLRKQAKELRDRVRTGQPKFTEAVRRLHPRPPAESAEWAAFTATFTLADAQLVLARWYGFASWQRLRAHLDMLAAYSRSPQRRSGETGGLAEEFLRLACLTYQPSWRAGAAEDADDVRRHARARQLLAEHPHLASASIHTAAAAGDIAAARSLLSADASLANREGGPHGWPPLLYLAFSRADSGDSTLEVARELLAAGADPNAGYLHDGQAPPVTALSGAFRGRQNPANQPPHQHSLALARLLLEAGADPDDERAVGNACGYPHDDAALALLLGHGLGRASRGPWPARLGDLLRTPARLVQDELRYAAEMNLPDRVRLLLRHCTELGIDIDDPGDEPGRPRTAYDQAVLAGNTGIAELLAAAGAERRPMEPVDEFVAACLRADGPAVRRMLAADPGLVGRALEHAWPQPLLHAAFLGRAEAVRLMVAAGFPLTPEPASPLHTAALAGHLDVVKLLVELGADPAAETVDDTPGQFTPPDRTPLGWARYAGHADVVAYLADLPG
jgi:ankyrin repeat protein